MTEEAQRRGDIFRRWGADVSNQSDNFYKALSTLDGTQLERNKNRNYSFWPFRALNLKLIEQVLFTNSYQ